jgi:hypothetical protein
MSIWSFLRLFGIFLVIWYIFSRFGMVYQEESGNPAPAQLPFAFFRRSSNPKLYFFNPLA